MPTFKYKARDESGKPVVGTTVAVSPEALADRLNHSGYTVISINSVSSSSSIDDFLKSFQRVKTDEMVMYTTQLASMIGSGLSLPASLHVLMEQVENQKLRDATADVYEEIKGGSSFSDALKKHSNIFSKLFVSMVQSGEVAGNLEETLKRLGTFAEKEAELKQKIMTAMFYPIILTVMGLLVTVFVIVTVLPPFIKIFTSANVQLPLPTKILFEVNKSLRGYWYVYLIGLIGTIAGAIYIKSTDWGKAAIDRMIFSTPVIGGLVRKVIIARFARTLAALLSSGISMLEALETVEKTINNTIISKIIKDVYQAVSKGENLSKPLKESGEFPAMPVQMIAVGEETGNLDVMLNKVADFYEISTDYSIRRLTSLLEPIFLIIIGGMVAFIFASIILPIFRMVGTMRR